MAKKRTHKQRKHRGGGWGFTGESSIPGTPGTVSNPLVYTGIGDCRAVKPGYDIPTSEYSASMKGLPGMSGGKRRKSRKTRKGSKTRKAVRRQRGGRYGFAPENDPNMNGQAWWAGSYAPIQRIACEGTTHNPLNPTHTGSSAPPGAASPNYWMKGGAQVAPATYGVGNVDSMYYYAPTAGYANTASTWKDSVGAPVQIQVPFAAREMNQACLSTGGHPPLTGALQKGGKKSRKVRKGGGFADYLPQAAKNLLGMEGVEEAVAVANENVVMNEGAPGVKANGNIAMNQPAPVVNGNKNGNVVMNQKPAVANIAPPQEPEEEVEMEVEEAVAPTGGRRHKKKSRKSRKSRKHRKGRKHH